MRKRQQGKGHQLSTVLSSWQILKVKFDTGADTSVARPVLLPLATQWQLYGFF